MGARDAPVHHWVVGSKYLSLRYTGRLTESIIGLYKMEAVRPRGSWRGLEEVDFVTRAWVDYLNRRQILEGTVNWPPAEAEVACYSQTEYTPLAA